MKTRLLTVILGLIVFEVFGQSHLNRPLGSFDKIAIAGGFEKIILKEGGSESVALEVSGIDAEKIVTEVKNNTLEIHLKKGDHGNYKATLTVTYKSLKEISNSGSSDIEALSTIKGNALNINSSGSGDFTGTLEVDKLKVAIAGSSDMKFNGKANQQDYAISGSGDINAAGMKGKEANVAISGSGDVSLSVDGPVRTAVSGSGDVKNGN